MAHPWACLRHPLVGDLLGLQVGCHYPASCNELLVSSWLRDCVDVLGVPGKADTLQACMMGFFLVELLNSHTKKRKRAFDVEGFAFFLFSSSNMATDLLSSHWWNAQPISRRHIGNGFAKQRTGLWKCSGDHEGARQQARLP